MKSETNKHASRTAHSRAKLVDASVEMIAESGLPGFALTNVGARAGVSRALAAYHFATRGELIGAVFNDLLTSDTEPDGLGLEALLTWVTDQAQRVAVRDPRQLALLQLAVGPGVDEEVPSLRKQYWTGRTQLIERHLRAAQAIGQVRDDAEISHLATVVLGFTHGELLRILATREEPSPELTKLIHRALAPEPRTKPGGRKASARPAAQPSLF